jgi:small subunit ribosomal protein S6
MMRIYENLFIVKPEQMSKNVTSAGGTVDKVDKWGKRRLAYRVEKQREGSYVLLQFTAEPAAVKEFERRMRVQDSVIKFLTVRIDETLKRLDKRKKEREKRAHRRPQPVAPQPSLAQAMLGAPAETGAHPIPGPPVAAIPGPPPAPVPAQPVTAEPAATEPKLETSPLEKAPE